MAERSGILLAEKDGGREYQLSSETDESTKAPEPDLPSIVSLGRGLSAGSDMYV